MHKNTNSRPSKADPGAWRNSSRSYSTWKNMIYRCTDPANPRYKDYGGRGIVIEDPRWLVFDSFLADMGERPPGMSLNRKNNDGPYASWNCEWATPHAQQVNSRLFKLVPEVVAEIKRLRATGMSLRAIGAEMDLNRKTVSRALTGRGRSRKHAGPSSVTGR